MPENLDSQIKPNELEAEIALLSKEIEKKRQILEAEKKVVLESDHKQIVKDVLTDLVSSTRDEENSAAISSPILDTDDESVVRDLVLLTQKKGIKQALNQAKNYSPFILDTFHDRLVDTLYQMLKNHGIIK